MNFHSAAPSTKLPLRISNIVPPFITCTTIILTLVYLHHPSMRYSTSILVSNLPSPSNETFQEPTTPSKTRESSSLYSNDSDPNPIIQQNDTSKSSPPVIDYNLANGDDVNVVRGDRYDDKECDLFSGEWVPNPKGPYYTNATCRTIQEHQNCMKYGRPNEEFLKWRWKPNGCDLAVFNPLRFLAYMRGKSLAFVGDSVARNHMQSFLCLLSRVTNPLDVSNTTDENFKHWHYKDYNFNISIFWSPYLVNTQRTDPNDISRPFNLYLDEFDESWTNKIETFDYVIISAGQWFSRPAMFYMQGHFIGCLYCPDNNVTHMTSQFGLRLAFQTAFRAINSLRNYKGVTFLRTITTSHFENGEWNKGGNCPRTRPYGIGEIVLEDYNLDMYNIQLEEFKIAREIGRLKGLKFRLFDVTQIMLVRPDGHPDKYGPWPTPRNASSERSDCVHWCLPGPIDTWNDLLLDMLRRDKITELL